MQVLAKKETPKSPLTRWLERYRSRTKAPSIQEVHEPQSKAHFQAISNTRKADIRRWLDYYIEAHDEELLSPLLQEVQHDLFDNTAIETRIKSIMPSIVIENGLCKACVKLLKHITSPRTQNTLFDVGSTYDMEAAERKGCKCCSFFMTEMCGHNTLWIQRAIEWRHEVCGVDVTSKVVAGWRYPWPTLDLFYPGKPTNMEDQYGTTMRGKAVVARLVKQNIQPQCVKMPTDITLHWLQKCIAQHPECCDQSSYMPTRLLEISNHLKLVLTADIDTVRYATLSYCWGTGPATYRLTTQNFESKLQYVDNLPRTCTDAIEIARQAGLNHIWIDALCIIQDDTADWQTESLQMQNVFGNSFLNIAASSATHAGAGCHSRPAYHCVGFVACGVQLQPCGAHHLLTLGTSLASRAWTLQERMQPARTISSGEHGLVWECRSLFASQDLPDGVHIEGNFPRYLRASSKPWDWLKLIQLYTAANLTYRTDKLVAISGLAKQQYKLTKDEYLAELWREDFLHQLCWQVESTQERPIWRAPSWSWASIDGACYWNGRIPTVQYGHYKEVPYVNVAAITVDADDRFGQVRGGQMKLAVECMIEGRLDARRAIVRKAEACHIKIGIRAIAASMDCSTDPYIGLNRTVYCVPICEESHWRSESEEDVAEREWSRLEGLVLHQHGEVYRRVGMFTYNDRGEDYQTLRKLMHDAAELRQENDDRMVITII